MTEKIYFHFFFNITTKIPFLVLLLLFNLNNTKSIEKKKLSRFHEKHEYLLNSIEDLKAPILNEKMSITRSTRKIKIDLKSNNSARSLKDSKKDKLEQSTSNTDSNASNETETSNTQPNSKDVDDEIVTLENIISQMGVQDSNEMQHTLEFHQNFVQTTMQTLDKIGSFQPLEKKCWLLQRGLEVLPGYDPVDNSFLSIFKSNAGKMPKSFRSLTLDIVMQHALLNPKDNNSIEILKTVTQLRKLKNKYNDKFIRNNSRAARISETEIAEITEKLNKLAEKKTSIDDRLETAYKNRTALEKNLENLAEQAKTQVDDYEKTVADINKIEENREALNDLYTVSQFQRLDLEIIISSNSVFEYLSIKKNITILSKAARMAKILHGLMSRFYPSTPENKKDKELQKQSLEISQIWIKLVHLQNFRKAEIDRLVGYIDANLKKLLEEQKTKIKNIQGLKQYQDTFRNMSNLISQINEMERDKFETEKELDDLEQKLSRKGVSKELGVDFVIPDSRINSMEQEYRMYLQALYNTNQLLPQNEQFQFKLEQSEEAIKLRQDNPELDELQSLELDVDNPFEFSLTSAMRRLAHVFRAVAAADPKAKPAKHFYPRVEKFSDYFQNPGAIQSEIFEKTSEIAKRNKDIIHKLYLNSKYSLEMVKNIRTLELKIDRQLGRIYAETYRLDRETKCFSDTKLAYDIFNLAKINAVFDINAFLLSFLTTLAQTSKDDVKRLIIIISSLFESDENIQAIATKLSSINKLEPEEVKNIPDLNNENNIGVYYDKRNYLKKKSLQYYIESFSRNFAVMSDSYKELTDYSHDLENQDNSFFRRIIARFKRIMFGDLLYILQKAAEDQLIEHLEYILQIAIHRIVDVLIDSIGVLWFIPFLASKLHVILANVIMTLVRFMLQKMGSGISALSDAIERLVGSVSKKISRKNFMKLNWANSIFEIVASKKPKETNKPKVSDLETQFFNAAQDKKDSFNQIEHLAIISYAQKNTSSLKQRILEKLRISRDRDLVLGSDKNLFSSKGLSEYTDLREKFKQLDLHLDTKQRINKVLKSSESRVVSLEAQHKAAFLRGCLSLV